MEENPIPMDNSKACFLPEKEIAESIHLLNLSEKILTKDWLTAEEDEAWRDL